MELKKIIKFVTFSSLRSDQQLSLVRFITLFFCVLLAFFLRLYAVIRFESVIHEFDPYFNYRTTKYLADEGFYSFHNWFDDKVWYPLGRIVGGTIYPGLMITSTIFYRVLNFLNISIEIKDVCVFLAPFFASATSLITYFLGKELKDSSTGLLAAALIAIVPGYISRSVAGSYDNEGIAIFCMLLTYYCWLKAIRTGRMIWSVFTSLIYFVMVSSWGGYVFLINIIPIHVLVLMIMGRYNSRTYMAYSVVYSLGTLLSMQISFVGFQPVQTSEHMGSLGVFGLCQIYTFTQYISTKMDREKFQKLLKTIIIMSLFGFVLIQIILSLTGKVAPWTGRFYSLLDPSYAKNNIPIIASVSEHQPTTWASFYFDLQFLLFAFPIGLYYCVYNLTDARIFIILYGLFSIYFTGVMVRLMLVLSPVMCLLGALGISYVLKIFMKNIHQEREKPQCGPSSYAYRLEFSWAVVLCITFYFFNYVNHCSWVTRSAYSSPSIVLAGKRSDGSQFILDDFRDSYRWLAKNTPEDAKIMSWWDYGYQITSMSNRTVLVDNNTWNNTHISLVGQAMASNEDHAYGIMKELDVDYVLVIFGGVVAYSSDDINKFLWMVRIGASTDRGHHIKEQDYFSSYGAYTVDKDGSGTMFNSLMYKLCYYRFGEMYTQGGKPPGYDRARNAEIGYKDIKLTHLTEAYTSVNWIVRIYKVNKLPNRGI
ncbi:hypothetical protein SNEBB_003131 [Seison nebaliae]|nr:hypothetical protein SNEBB_003131 [Seison nebaliae]